jgi:ribosomal protein S18 acetylase RimI-like enzyme
VAESNGIIAGFIITEEQPPMAHIITIDVVEAERRNGVGSALLNASEANMARRSVRGVGLETATNNAAAIAFWKKHGYRVEGVLKRYYAGSLDAYEMKKVLRAPRET